jgi:tetratricopeptide (TPR) repeat protein
MHLLLRLSAVALGLVFAAAAVHADELQEINRMMRQGQLPQSLERVDKFLAGKPRDAQGRFLKGLILDKMNRPNEAIQIFAKLSEDFPESPEPYNNLAVLYASQGQYEKARVALESSIRTHPSFAIAHENLGDIYAKLASQAYDKALQLDSSNTAAKTKLTMIGELIGGGTRTARAPARPEPEKTAEAAPAKAADTAKANALAGAAKSGAEPKASEPKAPEPKAPEPRPTEPAAKAAGSQGAETDELLQTVHAWANAWAKKDVPGYLAHYAKDFKTPKGEARADWEKARSQRIAAPKKIEIGIESPKVSISSDSSASVSFRQIYHSDVVNISGTKILVMVKANGKWLIREERVN